jgi:uridine kinase
MQNQDQIYHQVASALLRFKPSGKPLLVGINGVDGSGKTTLAHHLSKTLAPNARIIHIDHFQNSKEIRYARGEYSSEGYYKDSFNIQALTTRSLIPIQKATSFPLRVLSKHFDLETNTEDPQSLEIDAHHIVLCEGVFLFRPELSSFFDVKIFVDCDFETTLARMIKRDSASPLCPTEARKITQRFNTKYKPAQMRYLEQIRPKEKANIVIDNRDFTAPKLIKI